DGPCRERVFRHITGNRNAQVKRRVVDRHHQAGPAAVDDGAAYPPVVAGAGVALPYVERRRTTALRGDKIQLQGKEKIQLVWHIVIAAISRVLVGDTATAVVEGLSNLRRAAAITLESDGEDLAVLLN